MTWLPTYVTFPLFCLPEEQSFFWEKSTKMAMVIAIIITSSIHVYLKNAVNSCQYCIPTNQADDSSHRLWEKVNSLEIFNNNFIALLIYSTCQFGLTKTLVKNADCCCQCTLPQKRFFHWKLLSRLVVRDMIQSIKNLVSCTYIMRNKTGFLRSITKWWCISEATVELI